MNPFALPPGYIDPHGMFRPLHERDSNNGLSYTAVATAMGLASPAYLWEAARSCQVRPHLWLLNRRPGFGDQNNWDDYASLLAASCAVSIPSMFRELAKRIRKKHYLWGPFFVRGYMNNEFHMNLKASLFRHPDGRWNIDAWIGRFPVFGCLTAWCLWEKPSLWARFTYAASILFAATRPKTDQGAYRFGWLLVEAHEGVMDKSQLITLASEAFKTRVECLGGMAETQKGYFNDDHPFMTWWKENPL